MIAFCGIIQELNQYLLTQIWIMQIILP